MRRWVSKVRLHEGALFRAYEAAWVQAGPQGFRVLLDDVPIKTPTLQVLHVDSELLALGVASEWESQTARIQPGAMPLV